MNEAVFELQGYLRNIARYDSDIPLIVPDGIFLKETTEAVTAFQKKYGLSVTGTVDFETWERIIEINDKALFFFSQPHQTAPVKNEDFPLKKGKESPFNLNVNLMLSFLSSIYNNFTDYEVTSVFSDETQKQVRLFQSLSDIEVTGEVDKKTWNALSQLYTLKREESEA